MVTWKNLDTLASYQELETVRFLRAEVMRFIRILQLFQQCRRPYER